MTELGTMTRTEDGRCALRFERRLAHPPERVWEAITRVEHLRHWFAEILDYDAFRFEPRVGARLEFVPTTEYAQLGTSDGMVTRAEAPHLLEYTWGSEVLRWELEADGDGCLLVFTDIFDERDAAAAMGAGWHAGLDRLELFMAGRDCTESVLEDEAAWQQLQTDYQRALA